MYVLKKNFGMLLTSKSVATGPSSYEKKNLTVPRTRNASVYH